MTFNYLLFNNLRSPLAFLLALAFRKAKVLLVSTA